MFLTFYFHFLGLISCLCFLVDFFFFFSAEEGKEELVLSSKRIPNHSTEVIFELIIHIRSLEKLHEIASW